MGGKADYKGKEQVVSGWKCDASQMCDSPENADHELNAEISSQCRTAEGRTRRR
jgi:hypothetical protein